MDVHAGHHDQSGQHLTPVLRGTRPHSSPDYGNAAYQRVRNRQTEMGAKPVAGLTSIRRGRSRSRLPSSNPFAKRIMASLITESSGLRRIDVKMSKDAPRRSIRLGRLNAQAARSIHAQVQQLISDRLTQRSPDPELARGLASCVGKLPSRLRSADLPRALA